MAEEATSVGGDLRARFGDIDIYLFDQLLRGRFDRRRTILDAGCGGGRNLPFFLAQGFEVTAVDADSGALDALTRTVEDMPAGATRPLVHNASLDALPLDDQSMDAVICSAVLHFSRDEQQFAATLRELWRVLKDGGLFFARLATSIGLEAHLEAPTGRMRLPDGSFRFIVDEATLLGWTARLGGTLLDPIKTTNVQNIRAMTTWVMEKS